MIILRISQRRNLPLACSLKVSTRQHTSSSSPAAPGGARILSRGQLPSKPCRTRFAPSPTGYLHLGSLRTALFNFLLAKATGGQFLLRIEDTDQKRTVPDAEVKLCETLRWAGLQWDEGPEVGGPFGPYKQSSRIALYHDHAEKLLKNGHAYRCFCTQERLYALAKRRTDLGMPADYDRACLSISPEEGSDRAATGEAHVIRLKVPARYPEFRDIVYGHVRQKPRTTFQRQETFDDPIIMKSDGFPTYHLANVVDDHFMEITHVIRGAEWMSSTPKHLALYDAFGWTPPNFAHVGLLMDENGQKLSKRNLDVNISLLRDEMGIFPETLTNFVALLGWSHGKKKDVMDLNELIQNVRDTRSSEVIPSNAFKFSLKFTTGDTTVTLDKLWFLQRAYAERYTTIEETAPSKMAMMLDPIVCRLREAHLLEPFNEILNERDINGYIRRLLHVTARTYTTAAEYVERQKFFFQRPTRAEYLSRIPLIEAEHPANPSDTKASLSRLLRDLASLCQIPDADWQANNLRARISDVIADRVAKAFGKLEDIDREDTEKSVSVFRVWSKTVHDCCRWAMIAGSAGPSSAETMHVLGRKETLRRLSIAGDVLQAEVLAEIPVSP